MHAADANADGSEKIASLIGVVTRLTMYEKSKQLVDQSSVMIDPIMLERFDAFIAPASAERGLEGIPAELGLDELVLLRRPERMKGTASLTRSTGFSYASVGDVTSANDNTFLINRLRSFKMANACITTKQQCRKKYICKQCKITYLVRFRETH